MVHSLKYITCPPNPHILFNFNFYESQNTKNHFQFVCYTASIINLKSRQIQLKRLKYTYLQGIANKWFQDNENSWQVCILWVTGSQVNT